MPDGLAVALKNVYQKYIEMLFLYLFELARYLHSIYLLSS